MKQVWYVQGADPEASMPVLFATKMAAEMYARQEFPTLTESQRYARIFYRSEEHTSELQSH